VKKADEGLTLAPGRGWPSPRVSIRMFGRFLFGKKRLRKVAELGVPPKNQKSAFAQKREKSARCNGRGSPQEKGGMPRYRLEACKHSYERISANITEVSP